MKVLATARKPRDVSCNVKKKKPMLKYFTLIFVFLTSVTNASPQMPDYVIYGKDTIPTYNLILEKYLKDNDSKNTEELFGLSFRSGASSNCWRGYQAIYQIENNKLFLVFIIDCGSLKKIDKKASSKRIKSIFGRKISDRRVFIDWFSGAINFPLNRNILRWDGVFNTIYEREKVFEIDKGYILQEKNVENYVDNPDKIDRRNRDSISKILFRKLQEADWKKDKADCSDKYIVTIAEEGNISKVRMLYSEKEIEEYFDEGDYEFCTNKVRDALRSLNFDIIKEKGKPISEEIYIEIWATKDGKLEDWTR